VAALKDGHLAGAMLDVMDGEPLAAGNRLVGAPNLILSPHVAGITRDANRRASVLTAENVRLFLQGEPALVANAAIAA
jgi:(S)-sulfolactate dehydrogenase